MKMIKYAIDAFNFLFKKLLLWILKIDFNLLFK